MKKIVLLFSLLFLVSVGLLVGKHISSNDSKSATLSVSNEKASVVKSISDEKILVVERFWEQALSSNSVDDFIVSVPKEFFDDRSRCSIEEVERDAEAVSFDTKKESNFTRDLITTAKNIENEQRVLKTTRIVRQWKNEAIVETEFLLKNKPNISEKTYFFLYLIDGKWKIFLSTSLPDLLNKEYAKNECNK